ncbi:MAG: hypothetical protein ACRCYV_12040 [Aeromonas sp.]
MKIKTSLFILPLLLVAVQCVAASSDHLLDAYRLDDGKFYTAEGEVPAGCFGQLMTRLNGDNSVAAIYLNRNNLRGCIDANDTYPAGEESAISYTVVKNFAPHQYGLKVCEALGGSMRETCDQIIIEFKQREYLDRGKKLSVLSVEKLGDF